MTPWTIAAICFVALVILTFIPVLKAMLRKVKLHPGGESFAESKYFTLENKKLLQQHYSWKKN